MSFDILPLLLLLLLSGACGDTNCENKETLAVCLALLLLCGCGNNNDGGPL